MWILHAFLPHYVWQDLLLILPSPVHNKSSVCLNSFLEYWDTFLNFYLEDGCHTVLCGLLLHSSADQLCVHRYPPPSAFVPAPRSSLQAITEHPAELRTLTTLYFLQCLEKMSLPVIGSFQIFVNAKFPSYWIFYICNFIFEVLDVTLEWSLKYW